MDKIENEIYKVVGNLHDGKDFDILENEETGIFYIRDGTGIMTEFPFEGRVFYLSEPWDEVSSYTDESGVHYNNVIYDSIWCNLWAKDVTALLNLICRMLKPSDTSRKWFKDRLMENEAFSKALG